MSSVLHPVGPEPRERYWVRRLAVLVAAVVAIGIVIALVGNAMSAGSAVQAEPAPPPVVVPTLPPTASASPTASDGASPTPGSSPTAGTATGSASASATPSGTATTDPGQRKAGTSAAEKKAAQQAAEKKKAADQKKAADKKAAEKKKAAVTTCTPGDLRTTLTGPRTAKATKKVDFDVALINSSDTTCSLAVTGDSFTLTVVSGSDRIWSSDDCAKAVPAQKGKLATQKSADWSMTWDGKRSAPGCKSRTESPKPGYYWAIAHLDGAKEVRWRIILT